MNGANVSTSLGLFSVATTVDGGHSPEYYAERLCEKLIAISETAPVEVRLQALAFREAMGAVLLDGIRRAILSDHTTIISKLRQAGFDDAALLVLSLRS